MKFTDRIHAARQISDDLKDLRGKRPLVLALPKGAMPMAKLISGNLDGELDALLVNRFSCSNDYALGSVTEDGAIHIEGADHDGLSEEDIAMAAQNELKNLAAKRRQYTPYRSKRSPSARIVVIIDDGLATGATLTAAIRSANAQGALRVIVATPVISQTTLKRVLGENAEICALQYPDRFFTADEFFEDFAPVSETEVIAILKADERFAPARSPEVSFD